MGLGMFGNKSFEVSTNRVTTPRDIAISEGLKVTQEEVEGAKPTLIVNNLELKSITFTIDLLSQLCDIDSELDWWQSTLEKAEPQYLSLGTKLYGKFLLTRKGESANTYDKLGNLLKTSLSLTFTEFKEDVLEESNEVVVVDTDVLAKGDLIVALSNKMGVRSLNQLKGLEPQIVQRNNGVQVIKDIVEERYIGTTAGLWYLTSSVKKAGK